MNTQITQVEDDIEEVIDIDAFRCRNVWRAVIQQALEDIGLVKEATTDAAGKTIPIDARELYTADARARAARWILEGGRHFRHVCELADIDYSRIQAKVRNLLNACAS